MTRTNNKTKIFVSYHKKTDLFKNEILEPIHVGRDLAQNNSDIAWLKENMIGDNTGDNISFKNPNYCELTAQYWAWKNCKTENIGFFHYRRLLDITNCFANEEYAEDICIGSWNKENIEDLMLKYDIVLPSTYFVHPANLPNNILTNYEFYKREHNIVDLEKVIEIIKSVYPDYVEATNEYLNDTKSFFFNMFIMKWNLFDKYCSWLFDILSRLESKIEISSNSYQKRIFGFLSERLLNIFIRYEISKNKDLRVEYFDVINVVPKPLVFDKSKIKLGNCKYLHLENKILNSLETIEIVFSTDNNYISHCSAAIASILLNSTSNVNFKFHILDGGISNKNKSNIKKLSKIRPFDIEFYDMKKYDFSEFALNRSYISEATYYRLMLLDILSPTINKVIYLDCDIIVEKDIKELWDIDISSYCAGVVEDEGSISQIRRMNLPLENNYFNAGILVLNLEELRKFNFKESCFEYYKENESIIILQDQDILNGVLNGKCKFLPLCWNTNARIYLGNNLERKYSIKDEIEAGYNPGILHYTDVQKPWKVSSNHILKEEYWKYLSYTPFSNRILFLNIRNVLKCIYKKEQLKNGYIKYLFNIPIIKFKKGRTKTLNIFGIDVFKRIKSNNKIIFLFGMKLVRSNNA